MAPCLTNVKANIPLSFRANARSSVPFLRVKKSQVLLQLTYITFAFCNPQTKTATKRKI